MPGLARAKPFANDLNPQTRFIALLASIGLPVLIN